MAKRVQLPCKQEWIDALVLTCPLYVADGVFSHCADGTCCKGKAALCTRVTDVLKAFAQIKNKEIEVF